MLLRNVRTPLPCCPRSLRVDRDSLELALYRLPLFWVANTRRTARCLILDLSVPTILSTLPRELMDIRQLVALVWLMTLSNFCRLSVPCYVPEWDNLANLT